MNATDRADMQLVDEADGIVAPVMLDDIPESERLAVIANEQGDISWMLSGTTLAQIGSDCIADYERDENDRAEWKDTVEKAFRRAAQEKLDEKTFPWKGAANVNYPLLTNAALQFAARAYPAIVKGDEAVSIKVVGQDRGRPEIGPDGQPMMQMQMQMGSDGQPAPVMGQDGQPQPVWAVPPGGKAARANRVRDYMNTVIFYRMTGWEEDTDALCHQLPIAGCAFRKNWTEGNIPRSGLVPALKVCAPMTAKDVASCPRITEIREDIGHNEIIGLQRAGFYRDVSLVENEDKAAPRKLLEQYCLIDLDGDGYAEPYIVTLDHASSQVLRIEPDFGPNDVSLNERGEVMQIVRGDYWVKYDFFPSLDGKFYGTGLGHLLEQIGDVVNKSINQIIDAGTAQIAGGGFIASGVNLQGAGKRSGNLYFSPGEYKTVNVSGASLREGIYERTFPGASQITFNILDLMLGAAKDVSSVKDVLTGEASNNGQVGTTLALIEQGLQVFTAIYKRIYRSLKAEYTLLYRNMSRFGGEVLAQDYLSVLDDPNADFAADFNEADMDIRPVSDPTSVTRMQRMARAQFLMQFVSAPGVNPQAIFKRVWEAADVDDIDELLMPPAPPPEPNPKDVAQAEKYMAGAALDAERAETERQEREAKQLQNLAAAFATGQQMGLA